MNKAVFEELLSHAVKNPAATADKLIASFGTYTAIAEAEPQEIERALEGDDTTALYIKLSVAVASRRYCERLKMGKKFTEADIEEYLIAYFYGVSVETIAVISVDSSGRTVSVDKAGEGTVNFSTVMSRKILEIAKRRKARGVIIAHNHPGGYALPSDDDIASAGLLSEVLSLSGIELLGNYVVAGTECRKIDI